MINYWLDSNVFIEGVKGPYGFDLAPQFWAILDEMTDGGLLACPMMVYDELLDGQDDLEIWARNRRKSGMFADPDMVAQAQFQAVCAHVIGRYPDNGPRRRFLDRADPWVVAHALANDGTVVTHEQRNRPHPAK